MRHVLDTLEARRQQEQARQAEPTRVDNDEAATASPAHGRGQRQPEQGVNNRARATVGPGEHNVRGSYGNAEGLDDEGPSTSSNPYAESVACLMRTEDALNRSYVETTNRACQSAELAGAMVGALLQHRRIRMSLKVQAGARKFHDGMKRALELPDD
ncbi:hypothetical protein PUNSTDRAFT_139408 [Punctularia strigosozonata HHB-11173 SS5]|uniref:Uncharacterized protein n=1 Tax=Punctularia strigosozonata (strain HHB-11173) TaxID=741275 RepID=R7RZI1_PUNST|nr:uncharacterized protein PUNSTDRAFT_139408 [Punctularia strigosozonata HHB-11173 SS5]EIN03525.1 hypothetical protein PUNSTDRAFT_139408 [Punctularia strigosozonata HHB-11173 SS5]